MKHTLTYSGLLIASALLFSCGTQKAKKESSGSTEKVAVKVATLQKVTQEHTIHTSGQLTTNDETFLSFKTEGIISSILVKEGDYVRRGQLLATLDLTEINARVAAAQLAYDKAVRDYQRTSNLYKDSVATLEQLQNAKTGSDLAGQQLNAAKFNLLYSQIRAVSDGYILRKFVNPGQLITTGAPVFQTNGAGYAAWVLKTGLSDKEWAMVKIDDPATIVTDALPGRTLKAVVSRKSEGADPYTGSFLVELKITDKNIPSLAAGLFGKAEISASGKRELWAIPYEALLDGNGNKGYVYITNDNQKAEKVEVEISSIGKSMIYISKGLENARSLVIAGSPYLKENSLITVIQ